MSRPAQLPEPIKTTSDECPDLSGTYRDLADPSPMCLLEQGNLVRSQCSLSSFLTQLWSPDPTNSIHRSRFIGKIVIIDKWEEDKLRFRVRQDNDTFSEEMVFIGMKGDYATASCSGGALVFGFAGSDSMGGSGFALGSLSEKLYRASDGSLVMHVSGVAVGVLVVVPIVAGASIWYRWAEATPENIKQEYIERELGEVPSETPSVERESRWDFVNP